MSHGGTPTGTQDDHSTAKVESARARAFRPRALPTLAAIIAIVVCVAAGTWQRERFHAKEALRARFDAAARAEPVALATVATDSDWAELRYLAVVASGEFVASQQILV